MNVATVGVNRGEWPYKMKDLCELTGLPRQVIHFYIQQGLVPEGQKTGRNMAYYGESHVERIRLIRQLQHERFLPLRAIRAVLEERDEAFAPAQRNLLLEVRNRLRGNLVHTDARRDAVVAADVLVRLSLESRDLEEFAEIGLLAIAEDGAGRLLIAKDDVWLLELWADLRALGFSRDLGFTPSDLLPYEEAVSTMFRRETEVVRHKMSQLPPERLATMVERTLPLIHMFLTRYHEAKLRNFFAAMG